jgi:predicted DNA binding CopG/RHH family protein
LKPAKRAMMEEVDAFIRSCGGRPMSRMEPVVFPNLKPSTTTISLRLPDAMLNKIKVMANKQHVPYQSLIKMLLAEKIAR